MSAPPATHDEWVSQRSQLRQKLWALLGDLPQTFTPDVQITEVAQHDTHRIERFSFSNGAGAKVYGITLIPHQRESPAPAIVYLHPHGERYARGKDALLDTHSDGINLVQAGYIVVCIDAYGFGERQHQGPAHERESGRATEESLFKHLLWQGKTLWGMMLHDDLLTLTYIRSRADVDSARIGVTGMSMGGSRATWLAALDDDVKITVPIAQMTRYTDFAATGNFALHSFYYYVPGMLKSGIDMEHIVSLAAPRPQCILIGEEDPLSPFTGVQKITQYARGIYALYGQDTHFEVISYPNTAHEYTATMHTDMLHAFRRFL